MTESDLRTHAEDIHEQFSDRLDLTVEDVEERLETLVEEYKVPLDEARRSVTNTYLDEAGMDRDELVGGGNDVRQISDVDAAEEWIDITAKVVDLWEAKPGRSSSPSGRSRISPNSRRGRSTNSGTSSPTSTRAATR